MKLTSAQLKQIIKEELETVISEQMSSDQLVDMLLNGQMQPEQLNPEQIQMMKGVDWLRLAIDEAGGDQYQALSTNAYAIGEKIKKM
tara:strand:- start:31 stop:291 length:261 start_codon:yes stop_codon:yes gene_type:complete